MYFVLLLVSLLSFTSCDKEEEMQNENQNNQQNDSNQENLSDENGEETDVKKYVDLGLPSGTMWSADFEKDGNDIAYVPYEKAQKHEIPTSEQCAELFGNCKFMKKDNLFYCIGPNGNYVTFALLGYKELDNEQATYTVASLFWICNDNEKNNNTARLLDMRGITKDTYKEFTGNKIPIRLVRKK